MAPAANPGHPHPIEVRDATRGRVGQPQDGGQPRLGPRQRPDAGQSAPGSGQPAASPRRRPARGGGQPAAAASPQRRPALSGGQPAAAANPQRRPSRGGGQPTMAANPRPARGHPGDHVVAERGR
ncbi:proline-rich protein HaeIII subfamily 1-like [Zingiber officinale]|uniref:proline-rich protein HaeIII subfamily 1-like n=1 Tax=Zingiber officinale TaxID=94328 RepID=UPI001C4C49EE|nr:proline-rich protein HaeIII subfamily 1-like [Zingiber officinale]